MLNQFELETYLNKYLFAQAIKDYAPNGLQVQGRTGVQKIITGVSATQSLIDQAIAKNADAILVHHGYFWKNERNVLVGMKQRRIKALLANDINLYAYHLPLDVHEHIGNNTQLLKQLDLTPSGCAEIKPEGIIRYADTTQTLAQIRQKVHQSLGREPLVIGDENADIKRVAVCTGGGQSYIEDALACGANLFITGEASEQTTHIAREEGIHFIAAGHHATERYGVKALGEHLANNFALDVEFIDIDNPV